MAKQTEEIKLLYKIISKLEDHDKCFDRLETRIDSLEKRMASLEKRMDSLEEHTKALEIGKAEVLSILRSMGNWVGDNRQHI